jgi:hypothetical protein
MSVARQHDDIRLDRRRRPTEELEVQIGKNPDSHLCVCDYFDFRD